MAIHVQDKETDALVRDFAQRRGVGITDAIKIAVREARDAEQSRLEDLKRSIRPIVEEIRDRRAGSPPIDQKALMDDLWGEES